MDILAEELDVLFGSEKLLYTHSQEVVIVVPLIHELSPSQTILIKTILNRMGFSPGVFTWVYYKDDSEGITIQDSISQVAPKILLVIRPVTDKSITPEHKVISGIDVFYLPHPKKFEFDDNVKRPIWNLLKPFSCV